MHWGAHQCNNNHLHACQFDTTTARLRQSLKSDHHSTNRTAPPPASDSGFTLRTAHRRAAHHRASLAGLRGETRFLAASTPSFPSRKSLHTCASSPTQPGSHIHSLQICGPFRHDRSTSPPSIRVILPSNSLAARCLLSGRATFLINTTSIGALRLLATSTTPPSTHTTTPLRRILRTLESRPDEHTYCLSTGTSPLLPSIEASLAPRPARNSPSANST